MYFQIVEMFVDYSILIEEVEEVYELKNRFEDDCQRNDFCYQI